jgi:hypothetical protein
MQGWLVGSLVWVASVVFATAVAFSVDVVGRRDAPSRTVWLAPVLAGVGAGPWYLWAAVVLAPGGWPGPGTRRMVVSAAVVLTFLVATGTGAMLSAVALTLARSLRPGAPDTRLHGVWWMPLGALPAVVVFVGLAARFSLDWLVLLLGPPLATGAATCAVLVVLRPGVRTTAAWPVLQSLVGVSAVAAWVGAPLVPLVNTLLELSSCSKPFMTQSFAWSCAALLASGGLPAAWMAGRRASRSLWLAGLPLLVLPASWGPAPSGELARWVDLAGLPSTRCAPYIFDGVVAPAGAAEPASVLDRVGPIALEGGRRQFELDSRGALHVDRVQVCDGGFCVNDEAPVDRLALMERLRAGEDAVLVRLRGLTVQDVVSICASVPTDRPCGRSIEARYE